VTEWVETTLGALFTLDNAKLGAHDDEPTVMSLSKYDGFVRADEYFDKRIASERLHGYKVVDPGEWAFSTIHIDEGSIARNNLGERGVISPMYTTMRFTSDDCLPEYAELIVRQPSMLAEYGSRAHGTVNRRRSLPFKNFASIEFLRPSIAEQRRIVDVVASVDAQIEALAEERERAATTHEISISELLAEMPGTKLLSEVTSTRSGASFGASDVSSTPTKDSVPVIGIPNTKPDGSLDLNGVSHVSGLSSKVGRVGAGSLILIRTNGNRRRIGNVYLPPLEAHGHAVSAFQFLMQVTELADREFIYWVLREPSMQAAMSEAASGTTGLGNLAVKWLSSARVYWSDDPGERAVAVVRLRNQQAVLDGLRKELTTLRAFRASLLTALLNQEIEVPESYDSLWEAVS
jgi:type I restriction enzyme S subunit